MTAWASTGLSVDVHWPVRRLARCLEDFICGVAMAQQAPRLTLQWLHAPDVDESVCRQRCNAKTDCWQQANSRWSTSREFVEVGNPAAERVGDFFHARAARILMTATANRMTAFLCLLRSRESVSCSLEMLPSFGAGKSELDHQSSNEKDRQLAPETRGHRCNSNYCKMTRQELATTMQSSSGEAIKQGPY